MVVQKDKITSNSSNVDPYAEQLRRVYGNNYLESYPTDPGYYAITNPNTPGGVLIISPEAIGYSLDRLKAMPDASAPQTYTPNKDALSTISFDWWNKPFWGQINEAVAPYTMIGVPAASINKGLRNVYNVNAPYYNSSRVSKFLVDFSSKAGTAVSKITPKLVTWAGPAIDIYQIATSPTVGDKAVNTIEGITGGCGTLFGLPGALAAGALCGMFEVSGAADGVKDAINNEDALNKAYEEFEESQKKVAPLYDPTPLYTMFPN